MANNTGQGYLANVLRRGAQPVALAPARTSDRAHSFAPPPVGVVPHNVPQSRPGASPVVSPEATLAETTRGPNATAQAQPAADMLSATKHQPDPATITSPQTEDTDDTSATQSFINHVDILPAATRAHTSSVVAPADTTLTASSTPPDAVDLRAQPAQADLNAAAGLCWNSARRWRRLT